MRIARFLDSTKTIRSGIVQDDEIVCMAGGVDDWLAASDAARAEIIALAIRADHRVPLASVRLLAPIACPRKFLAIGGNYASHIKEIEHLGIKAPETQLWFNKQTSCIVGPFDEVAIPSQSGQVDYEGELVVVIGRRCRNVPRERANEVIAGYMAGNDVSVRDVQLRSPTMTLGKSFDTHGPIGPWLVTRDEIGDPQRLAIRTWVNGELRQEGSTAEMRFSIAEQIAELSSVFTLDPGDLLATGTPAGVGGAKRPPCYLKRGDVVRIEIAGIGAIENHFVTDNTGIVIE